MSSVEMKTETMVRNGEKYRKIISISSKYASYLEDEDDKRDLVAEKGDIFTERQFQQVLEIIKQNIKKYKWNRGIEDTWNGLEDTWNGLEDTWNGIEDVVLD